MFIWELGALPGGDDTWTQTFWSSLQSTELEMSPEGWRRLHRCHLPQGALLECFS